ncbi:Dabb family protein [Streptomyces sp. NPDC054784]
MIYHGIRMKLRDDVTPEQVDEALECLKAQGRDIPAVKAFVFGTEYGGDYDWSAVFALEDLDGYGAYLAHPAHARSERVGFPLMARFESFDICDTPDPGLGARIAELQRRNYARSPQLASLVAGLDSHAGSSAVPYGGG